MFNVKNLLKVCILFVTLNVAVQARAADFQFRNLSWSQRALAGVVVVGFAYGLFEAVRNLYSWVGSTPENAAQNPIIEGRSASEGHPVSSSNAAASSSGYSLPESVTSWTKRVFQNPKAYPEYNLSEQSGYDARRHFLYDLDSPRAFYLLKNDELGWFKRGQETIIYFSYKGNILRTKFWYRFDDLEMTMHVWDREGNKQYWGHKIEMKLPVGNCFTQSEIKFIRANLNYAFETLHMPAI